MAATRPLITSTSPEHTASLAEKLAHRLEAGDVILLQGDVGAGKTHFARHLIQSILLEPEDIPSPTFTLVQVYETQNGTVWHSDLYRISSILEIEELGLNEAFETSICLVEWPDRLGELSPPDALTLEFSAGATPDSRQIAASWTAQKWTTKLTALEDT